MTSMTEEQEKSITIQSQTQKTAVRSRKYRNSNFETRVGQAEFLLKVLKEEPADRLTGFGITAEAITALEGIISKVKATDLKQGDLKAQLKVTSAQVRDEMHEMDQQYATLKRKVKAEAQMEEWKRYGIEDKQ